MSRQPPDLSVRLFALAGFLAGPSAALAHEVGLVSVGPSATLWPVGFVVFLASVGILVGVGIASRGSRLLAVTVVLPNLLVLATYGFFLVFFGLGGSR